MNNRTLACSATLAITLTCLGTLQAANYLQSLARLHQNFVQLTTILNEEADIKLALELSRQEQTAREKKAQEEKEQKEKKTATSTVTLASQQAKITDETQKAWPPLTGGPRPTFPAGSVWAIQGRTAKREPTRPTWTQMDKALTNHDLETVERLLPQFGYYPGGALMGRQQRPLGEVADYHLKQAPLSNDAQTINQMINAIQFYEKGEPFYEFTNFYYAPITIDGVTWSCTEVFFQAQKFNWDNKGAQQIYQEFVDSASTMAPQDAFDKGRINNALCRKDWHKASTSPLGVKVDVMRQALEAKFTQHADLKKLLLSTGDLFIIEASPIDDFWGTHTNPCTSAEQQQRIQRKQPPLKCDGTGDNWLGRLLVETREKIRSGQI